jgi:hypothetical protein
MTDQQHPITPPPELVDKWFVSIPDDSASWKQELATQAAQWGADQELEACLQWFSEFYCMETWMQKDLEKFRTARRPEPPSLKEQALGALYAIATGADDTREFHQDLETIKTALESLPD